MDFEAAYERLVTSFIYFEEAIMYKKCPKTFL